MIARAGSGWQTVLADLSLILFMLTAATLSQTPEAQTPKAQTPEAQTPEAQTPKAQTPEANSSVSASPVSQPIAVYAAGPGAPPLADWLADQPADPRQQLTIIAHYTAGGREAALAAASAMIAQAGGSAMAVRLVVEPGSPAALSAVLAYDVPQNGTVLALTEALSIPAGKLP
jgi:hypothetical protein